MPIGFEGGDVGPQQTNMTYSGNRWVEVKEYVNSGTTTNGLATFYLTTDGTAAGAALFKNVLAVTPSVMLNAANPGDAPKVSVRSISADRKTLVVQASRPGAAVTLLSTSLLAADVWVPNGTTIYVRVTGE